MSTIKNIPLKSTFIVVALFVFISGYAQEQVFELGDIALVSENINSSADEIMPIPSPDGKTVYFVRGAHEKNIGGRFGGQDIWYSIKNKKGDWSKAQLLNQFNNRGNNAVVGIDQSGKRIYLLNSYENDYGTKSGLSYSDKVGESWTPPVVTTIEGIYNRQSNDIYGLSVNDQSDVLLISMNGPESMGAEDLYVSFKFTGWNRFHQSNTSEAGDQNYWWSPPIHLGNQVNSKGYDISPFLSADGNTLFFASNRQGGYGSGDIYYATRLDDTWKNWSTPVNMGRKVNSRRFEAYFHLSADSTIYFSSARKGRFADIYTSKLLNSTTEILTPRIERFEQPYRESEKEEVMETPNPIPHIQSEAELETLNRIERNILFDHNSDNLLLKSLDILENTVAILNANKLLEVHLFGHTDKIGNAKDNHLLADKRAKSVRNYLVEKGIPNNRIVTESHGESKPIANNEHHTGREQNRRVELYFKISGTLEAFDDF